MTRLHTTLSSLLAATVFSMAGGTATQAHAQGATPAADATATSDNVPALKGKRIGITVTGTEHYWDLKAYQGADRRGEAPRRHAHRARCGPQRQPSDRADPDADRAEAGCHHRAIGHAPVLQPWLRKVRARPASRCSRSIPFRHPASTIRPPTISSSARSWRCSSSSDINGEGNILVFNGFYSVPVCAIRYDELKLVLQVLPELHIIQPELRDVIPNTVQSAYSAGHGHAAEISEQGDIAAVWSAWDVPQVGATQAMVAAHRTRSRPMASTAALTS